MSKGTATALAVKEPQQQQAIPPRLRGRDYARIAAIPRVALPYELDKYGYPIQGSEASWEKVRDQDRQWYAYIVFRARKTGVAWPSYATMAEDRECSIETAQRYMRRLEAMGFISKEHAFDEKSGDFTSNRYWPHNPLEPHGDALAIEYRGKVIRAKQTGEIPPLPEFRVRRCKPKTPHPPKAEERPPLVILPHFYKQVAQQEGLRDLVLQSQAWDAFLKAKRENKIERRENPNAYFRGIVQKIVAQARLAAAEGAATAPAGQQPQQATLFDYVESPAHEAVKCMAFLEGQAVELLAQGYDPAETIHRLITHPHLHRFTRLHAPQLEDVAALVDACRAKAQALKDELERRRRPLAISDEARTWLSRFYQTMNQNPGRYTRDGGTVTPARAAQLITLQPSQSLPAELRDATPEQVEGLLLRITGN